MEALQELLEQLTTLAVEVVKSGKLTQICHTAVDAAAYFVNEVINGLGN